MIKNSQQNSIRIIDAPLKLAEVKEIAQERFGDMVKAVVDVEKGIMAIGGDLHADEEAVLLENGSRQENLWGVNLYPENKGTDFIEFDSMINIRPRQNNRSRGVESEEIRQAVIKIINQLVN